MLTVTTPTGSCTGAKSRWATRSLATSSSAPMQAAGSRRMPAALFSRLASCGATSATKAMGPAIAVVAAVSSTARTIMVRRVGSTCTPSAVAVSSPISSMFSFGPPAIVSARIGTIMISAGMSTGQPTPLRVPAPHTAAAIATSISARSTSHWLRAASIAEMPIPTRISRKPWEPRRQARKYTATAVSRPPASAPSEVARKLPPTSVSASSAPV